MMRVLARHISKRYAATVGFSYRSPNECTLLRQVRWKESGAVASRSARWFGTSQHYSKEETKGHKDGHHNGKMPGSYTTAFAMFEGLWEAGVRNCFVNVGSDHPSVLEAFVKGKRECPGAFPRMITCPSEMTAISIADGYARVTGRPQAVLVHVDVGTQALAHGVHNASIGRVPVIILAGLCPSTESGELPGSKTEYSNWLQDAHDQTAIVRQYCRYAGEIRTGVNVKQMLGRALQFAMSGPKGPVYLSATREVLAQDIEPYSLKQEEWFPVSPSALPGDAVEEIAHAMIHAKRPLVITGYSGRNRDTPELLVLLANVIPHLRIHDTGGSDMCFPASHPSSEGFRLSTDECTKDADVILILDCDIPWIPSKNAPRPETKIYHIDIDSLNAQLRVSFFPAHRRWRADSFTALTQLVDFIDTDLGLRVSLHSSDIKDRAEKQAKAHAERTARIRALARLADEDALDGHNVGALLKSQLPPSTTFVVEAVTNSQIMHDQLQPSTPGKWLNCGATGIGWSNGATVGVKMALQDEARTEVEKSARQPALRKETAEEMVCQVVGDGSFMCAAPESALWVARKYNIPVLIVVLNNGGWNAPRNSVEMVYPDGLNKSATADELSLSFKPSPNYAAMAEAVAGGEEGWMMGVRVRTVSEMKEALEMALERVQREGKAMVIEVLMS
ncbi:thiamine pyrophosphate enzyme [Phaeosphaeria sp. MPI-PUGE-AT-0046c]|nr:thiamine pyrophosphate enzyme [Phaeosphaeria sp. MPI-PUGE-AT-0046c]